MCGLSCEDRSSFCHGVRGVAQGAADHCKRVLMFVSGIINLWHIRKSLNGTGLERNNCLPIKMNTDV